MKVKGYVIDEDALIERILPKIEERVKADVMRSLVSALKAETYPPEEEFRDEFVKQVERASKSRGKAFKTVKEFKTHLEFKPPFLKG